MKRITSTLFIALAFIAIMFTSCKKDNSSAFLGTYSGTTSVSGANPFSDVIKVTAGSGSNDLVITEVSGGNANFIVNANATSNSTLVIPSQSVIVTGGSITVQGTGTLSGNTLSISFTEAYGANTATVTFQGTK